MMRKYRCTIGIWVAVFSFFPAVCHAVESQLKFTMPNAPMVRNIMQMQSRMMFQKSAAPAELQGVTWSKAKNYVFGGKDAMNGQDGDIKIFAVLDASQAEAKLPDCVRFNMQGKPDFSSSGAFSVPLKFTGSRNDKRATIDTTRVKFELDGKEIDAYISGMIYYSPGRKYCYIQACISQVAWAAVKIGDENYLVILQPEDFVPDFTKYPEKSKPLCAVIPEKPNRSLTFSMNISKPGEPARIGSEFYDVKITGDGGMVDVTPYAGPVGRLELPAGMNMIMVVRGKLVMSPRPQMPDAIYTIAGDPAKSVCISLPADKYTLVQYARTVGDKNLKVAITATISSPKADRMPELTITAGETLAFPCSDSFVFKPMLNIRGNEVTLTGVSCDDKSGLAVRASGFARKVAFYSADGKLVHEGTLEYG